MREETFRKILREELQFLKEREDPPNLLTPEQVAVILQVEVTTLAVWRSNSKGPKWSKKCGIRYRVSDLNAWLDEE